MNSSSLDIVMRQSLEFDRPIVVDSSALIAYLGDEEPIASLVATVIDNSELDVLIPVLVLS